MAPRKQPPPRQRPQRDLDDTAPELADLENKDINELLALAREFSIEEADDLSKQDLQNALDDAEKAAKNGSADTKQKARELERKIQHELNQRGN